MMITESKTARAASRTRRPRQTYEPPPRRRLVGVPASARLARFEAWFADAFSEAIEPRRDRLAKL